MSRRPSIPIALTTIFVCFLLGVFSVLWQSAKDQASASTASEAGQVELGGSTPQTVSPQTTLLVLGVDDLNSPHPSLLSVWYCSIRPPGHSVYLFGFAVDYLPGDGIPKGLRERAFWAEREGVPQSFLDAMYAVLPVEPNAVLVLDEVAFASIVDFLGGVEIEGTKYQGDQIAPLFELLDPHPDASLSAQMSLMESLVARANGIESAAELTSLTALIPSHAYLSTSLSRLVALSEPFLPFDANSVTIRLFPSGSGN